MELHKRLITLVGLGMSLVLGMTIYTVMQTTAVFLNTTSEVENVSRALQRIWGLENRLDEMQLMMHNVVETSSERSAGEYQAARTAVRAAIDDIRKTAEKDDDDKLLSTIERDLRSLEQKSDRLLGLVRREGADRTLIRNLLFELDSLHAWMGRDISRFKEDSASRTGRTMEQLEHNRRRMITLIIAMLSVSLGFLALFGMYLHRKVSQPVQRLILGADEISKGNLDHRIPLLEGSDLDRLGERFNGMADRLKASYVDLERKLLVRTRHLAALDSVALALGKGDTIEAVLSKALELILGGYEEMEPRGGIFLCDPDGEHLRLAVHLGLSREFAAREETIAVGECLCGTVARTGETLYAEKGCDDPRHTRFHGEAGKAASHIIVPLKSRDIVLGVMFLYPRRTFTLKPSDTQLFDSIGSQLGMAIENFRFYTEVKRSSEKFWDLFENSRDLLCILDTQGRFSVVNKAAESFLGRSKLDLAGRDFAEVLTTESAEQVQALFTGGENALQDVRDIEIVRKDGDRATLEVVIRKVREGHAFVGYHLAARDVTDQRRMRGMLLEGERLAAICQLGIAVRHEINNPLTTVIGNTELLLEEAGDDADLQRRLDTVLQNALRIADIVKRLEEIRKDKVTEYLEGVKMTDLHHG